VVGYMVGYRTVCLKYWLVVRLCAWSIGSTKECVVIKINKMRYVICCVLSV